MKNKITLLILVATLIAPQAALWADEATTGGTALPNATSPAVTSDKTPGHKKHHHHHHKKPANAPAAPNASGAGTTNAPPAPASN
jgi:hypothetical protein